MGKSRSAAVCIAYLLHRQPKTQTPESALALLREARPLCEPNEGFMEQLKIYHEMGCPDDDVTGHPLYNRWLYRREVEESVACGRAPEMNSVLFEDEQPHKPQDADRSTEIKCRKCRYVSFLSFSLEYETKCRRRVLATTPFIIPHEQQNNAAPSTECAHVFLHPLTWMRPCLFPNTTPSSNAVYGSHPDDAPLSGRLTCPNTICGQNIGKFAWQGMRCSCGSWIVPAIGLAKARVDVVNRTNFATRSPAAALGIRLPPGMRPNAKAVDDTGKGNL